MLELTKAGGKGLGREEMRDKLKESQAVLLTLAGTDLNAVAAASVETHKEMVSVFSLGLYAYLCASLTMALHPSTGPQARRRARCRIDGSGAQARFHRASIVDPPTLARDPR